MAPSIHRCWLSVFLLAAGLAVAEDAPEHLVILSQPQRYQLPAGKTPGTFHFARKSMRIAFTQKPVFPVRVVGEDYAHHQIFEQKIAKDAPFDLDVDLSPGTYDFDARPLKDDLYWPSRGFAIHIDPSGVMHFADAPEFSRTLLLKRKIVILAPKNLEVVPGKPVLLGSDPKHANDPDYQRQLLTDTIRWKPLPGIDHYVVEIWPLENPYHPDSIVDEPSRHDATGASFRFAADDFFGFGEAWALTIYDGTTEDQFGTVGRGSVAFITAGSGGDYKAESGKCFVGDEWVEPRLGMRLAQPFQGTDDPAPRRVRLIALGTDSPAIKAGLQPRVEIWELNGQPTRTLDAFRAALAKIPPGSKVRMVVGAEMKKRAVDITTD